MLKSLQDIDMRREYPEFFANFPEERIEFLEKRLADVVFSRIQYLSNGKSIQGYIAKPKKLQQKAAVIIYNRGGNNYEIINGKKGQIKAKELFMIMGFFAQAGFVVVGSNYSGGEGSEGVDEFGGSDVDDVINLYDVIGGLDYVDSEKIGMLGFSRGGMMTYLCMKRKTPRLKTAVTVGGTANLCESAIFRSEMLEQVYKPIFGGSQEEMIKRSAVYWVSEFDTSFPFLICHGNDDDKVPVSESISLLEKSIQHGCNCRAYFYEHGDHALFTHPKEALPLIKKWYENHLQYIYIYISDLSLVN